VNLSSPLQILLLEDDATDAELLQDLLETENFICEITRAEDRTGFLAALERGGIDLILADYTLPSFDGLSALKLAMSACPDVPFIFVSGTLGEEVAIEALKIGATDYVLKTRIARLVPSVHRALREANGRAERKRAEEALRRSEAYLAEAESLSKSGSWAWKPAANEVTYWSPGRYRLFGFDPAAGVPTLDAVLERMHPEDRTHWLERTMSVVRGGEAESDFRIVLPNGEIKHVHGVGHPFFSSSGDVVEIIGTAVDVTERKRAEDALRESEEQWKAVFENNPTMYFMEDSAHTILSVNPFGAEQLGYTPEELVGAPVEILIHEADRDGALRNKAVCLQRLGQTMTWELRKVRKSGEIVWVRETGRGLLIKGSRVVLIVSEDTPPCRNMPHLARRQYFQRLQVRHTK
jgi:PAS domain S-box-containing protein